MNYFLKNELLLKDPIDVDSRSKRTGLSMGTFYTLVEVIDQLPTSLQQTWCFSHEKNRFLATLLTIWTYF